MTCDFKQRMALHNAQVELEALRAEGRGMVWENEHRMHAGHSVAYGDEAFTELATKIRATKVEIQDAITMEKLR